LESNKTATVLMVDDSKLMLVAGNRALKDEFNVVKAKDGAEAWDIISSNPDIRVVFTDLMMPVMDGHELLAKIRNCPSDLISRLPVVILTGKEDGDSTKETVLANGATDFLTKPFSSIDLLSRARSLHTLNEQVNELGKKATFDPLTGLHTLTSFNDDGERAFSFAKRHNSSIAVLRLVIDNHSDIEQCHDKASMDAFHAQMAGIIKNELRNEDVAAHLGRGKFSILLNECEKDGGRLVADRIYKGLKTAVFAIDSDVTLSIGCSDPLDDKADSYKKVYESASEALKAAMRKGGGEFVQTSTTKLSDVVVPRINVYAVIGEIEKGNASKLSDRQMNAAMHTMLPLLREIQERFDIDLHEHLLLMEGKAKEFHAEELKTKEQGG